MKTTTVLAVLTLRLVCTAAAGEAAQLLNGLTIRAGVGASGWTWTNRIPLLNGNAATEYGREAAPAEFPFRSTISIPLETQFGPLAVLTLYSCRPDAFHRGHLRALLAVGSRLAYQLNLSLLRPEESNVTEQLGRLADALRDTAAAQHPVSTSAIIPRP